MRLRSASRWRCGGVETDAAQNGPGSSLPQSPPEAAATGTPPECSERGGGRVRAPLPSAGQGRAWGGRMEHPERPAAGLQPRCASTLRGPRCVGPFSPRLSIIQPPPRPYSFLLPPPQTHPARPPQPAPFIHTPVPSPPHHRPPAAATASGSAAPRSPPVPADWRGGAPRQPASAAQPRPFSRGRGVAQTRPPALDVLLANALVRPAVFHAPQLSVRGDSGASLVSTQPPPPWPAGAGAEPGAAGQRPGRNTLSPASSSHRG